MAQLRRENLELRQQAGYWRSRHAVAKQQIAALEQEVAQLCGENRKLQDQLFGHKIGNVVPDRSLQSPRRPRRDRAATAAR